MTVTTMNQSWKPDTEHCFCYPRSAIPRLDSKNECHVVVRCPVLGSFAFARCNDPRVRIGSGCGCAPMILQLIYKTRLAPNHLGDPRWLAMRSLSAVRFESEEGAVRLAEEARVRGTRLSEAGDPQWCHVFNFDYALYQLMLRRTQHHPSPIYEEGALRSVQLAKGCKAEQILDKSRLTTRLS